MTKKKTIGIIFLYIALISLLRIGWTSLQNHAIAHPIEDGVLDLSHESFSSNTLFSLEGKWDFYPNQFVDPLQIIEKRADVEEIKEKRLVPGDWLLKKEAFSLSEGYGTYHIRLAIPKGTSPSYGLIFSNIATSADIYINESKRSSINTPTKDGQVMSTQRGQHSFYFETTDSIIDVTIHVSNHESPTFGGITGNITFGQGSAIQQKAFLPLILQGIVATIFLLHILYILVIYIGNSDHKQKDLLYFAFFLFVLMSSILIDDAVLIQLPVSFGTHQKILFFLLSTSLISILFFTLSFFNVHLKRIAYYKGAYGLLVLSILL